MENSPQRIIIGGSEEPLLQLIVHTLAEGGFEVEVTRSHRALLERCRTGHYGLIITRFARPLIASPDDIARLRGRRRTPLFVLSHTRNQRIVVALLGRGVTQFLSLPIALPRLRRKVELGIKSQTPPHTNGNN